VFLAVAFAGVMQARTLRVCAAPDNLPFSNRTSEGFDNKIAELLANVLQASLAYTWIEDSKAEASRSLASGACDVLTGVPSALDDVAATEPYYRSSYVFVSRGTLGITSLLDDRLAQLRIGINVVGNDYAPPAAALARRGITQNIVSFPLAEPHKIVDAVDNGEVDLAIVWGPVAGYFAKSARHPVTLTPVSPPAFMGIPFTFQISMAVRKNDTELRDELNRALAQNGRAIKAVLTEYGVPQIQ
jgi:mxaJ protein